MKNWELERRDLLKGLGLGICMLPMLKATRSYAATATFPARMMVVLLTEGYQVGQFAPPTGLLANQALPPVTTPLEKHKQDLIIFANLNNPQFYGCFKWGHGTYGTIFAQDRGDPKTGNGKEYWEPLNPTFDQVIAQSIVKTNPQLLPSLHLSVRVGTNSGGTGSNRCFYSGPVQAVTPEPDPYKVFNSLFAGKPAGMADPAADKVRAERKSLLDFVGGRLEKFGGTLGTEDRTSIQGHLESIRTLEKELTMPRATGAACATMFTGDASKPVDIGSNNNNGVLMNLHFQIMTAALACDATRIATLQFGDATGGAVTFPEAGVNRDWHSLGHNPGTTKIIVDKWNMTLFSSLLDKIKAVQEGGETMLDHMTVLWANHMESGNTHGATKLPWILAGKGNGFWKTGQSLPETGKNNTHVLATICNAMGLPLTKFGDGEPMPELKA